MKNMGDSIYGKCEICGKETTLIKTTFYYNIKCLCHSPVHFVSVLHCKDCKPKPPKEIAVKLAGDDYIR